MYSVGQTVLIRKSFFQQPVTYFLRRETSSPSSSPRGHWLYMWFVFFVFLARKISSKSYLPWHGKRRTCDAVASHSVGEKSKERKTNNKIFPTQPKSRNSMEGLLWLVGCLAYQKRKSYEWECVNENEKNKLRKKRKTCGNLKCTFPPCCHPWQRHQERRRPSICTQEQQVPMLAYSTCSANKRTTTNWAVS